MSTEISVVKAGAYYKLPTYTVTDTGLQKEQETIDVKFVKGTTNNPDSFKQTGTRIIDVLAMSLHHLESLYSELPNEYTERAVEHIRKAMMELEARTKDRESRGVINTNNV